MMRRSLEQRFASKVALGPGCMLWMGARKKGGYGILANKTQTRSPLAAHRLAFEFAYGPVPKGLWVLHTCDNPPCVNPEHLFLGDARDNSRDAAAKGRICTISRSRMTQCKHGHDYKPETTYIAPPGYRKCRLCIKNHRLSGRKRFTAIREQQVANGDMTRHWWIISVGGGYGEFNFLGTEHQAEQMRVHKAQWEGAVARKRLGRIVGAPTSRACDWAIPTPPQVAP